MYRNRLTIWILVVFVWTVVYSASHIDVGSMIIENKKINIMCDADTSIKTAFSNNIKGLYSNIVQTKDGADFIITNLPEEAAKEKYQGFIKTDDYIFSPIIIYYPASFQETELFYKLNGSSYFVDMKALADAVIEGKTYEDSCGDMSGYVEDATITFYMPSKSSLYYDKAVEAIYAGLNNNNIPTDEEKEALKPIVDQLLLKAKTCNNIPEETENSQLGDLKVFIGPEYIMAGGGEFGTSSYSSSWAFNTAYFEKSNAFKYDIYIKDCENKEELKALFDSMVIENQSFPSTAQYRTSYQNDYEKAFHGANLQQIDFIY